MGENEVFALRLKQARTIRKLSLDELVEELKSLGVALTKQAISRYENEDCLPGSKTLLALSKVLGQPIDYFFREPTIQLGELSFRKKKTKLSVKEELSIKESAQEYFERYLELETILGLDSSYNPPFKLKVTSEEDVDKAAEMFREKLVLEDFPISNVIELLESEHIKIHRVNVSENFDGFHAKANDDEQMVICVNSHLLPSSKNEGGEDFDLPRFRLTCLHEVAHDLLEFDDSIPEREADKMCNRFAGAVLIPDSALLDRFGGKRSMITNYELESAKADYGISIYALVIRLYQGGFINQQSYKMFCIQYNKRGYGRNCDEPGKYEGNELPKRFKNLIGRALAEGKISQEKAAHLAGESISQIKKRYSNFI